MNASLPPTKKKVHFVVLDNGRLEMAKDRLFSQVFRCVRCGACANVCAGGIDLPRLIKQVAMSFPLSQSCCGLPLQMMGEAKTSRDVALQNIQAFEKEDVDHIVTLCASCASHLKHNYPVLLTDCPGCIMQLRGGLKKRGSTIIVQHTAEALASRRKVQERP